MGKLMLFGKLRSTKMELRRTLETPKEAPREPKWGPRRATCEQQSEPGPLGSLLEPVVRVLGALRGLLGVSLGLLEGSWGLLERSWELFGASWEALGSILERSWEHLGAFWVLLEGVWRLFWRLDSIFEAICSNIQKP